MTEQWRGANITSVRFRCVQCWEPLDMFIFSTKLAELDSLALDGYQGIKLDSTVSTVEHIHTRRHTHADAHTLEVFLSCSRTEQLFFQKEMKPIARWDNIWLTAASDQNISFRHMFVFLNQTEGGEKTTKKKITKALHSTLLLQLTQTEQDGLPQSVMPTKIFQPSSLYASDRRREVLPLYRLTQPSHGVLFWAVPEQHCQGELTVEIFPSGKNTLSSAHTVVPCLYKGEPQFSVCCAFSTHSFSF